MPNLDLKPVLFVCIVSLLGCERPDMPVATTHQPSVIQEQESVPLPFDDPTVKPQETKEVVEAAANKILEQVQEKAGESEQGIMQKASDLINQAKSKSASAAKGTGQWVQDQLGNAAESGEQAVTESWNWANETFQSLKDQGLTTASDTSEWLSQDWDNIDSWEYKVVVIGDLANESLAKELNEHGKEGWECFHIADNRYFFKKPSSSYLRSLPFKDVIKLVPLMGLGGDGEK